MRQLESNIFSFFLSPLNWIFVLLIIAFFAKSLKVKRVCKIAALFIFIVFSNEGLLNGYAKLWQPKPRDVSMDKPYSCGIVLGGFASPDENGNGYFNTTCDRFIQIVKLYKLGKIKYILISGGNGKTTDKDFNEAIWAKNEMKIMGIPDSVILHEDKSDNTADNALNTKRLLDSAHLKPPYLLVTSAFHIPRAALIFKNAGINTIAFPCNYLEGNKKFSTGDILPQSEALEDWNYYIKETAGYLLYSIKSKL